MIIVTASVESWVAAWTASPKNPYIFATQVLPLLPYGSEPVDGRPVLEKWQDEFLREFYLGSDGVPVKDPRHSIRSGHGVGKTTMIAVLALWFILTRIDAKCVITAASQDQLRDGAWAELRKWWRTLPIELQDQLEVFEERASMKVAPELGFIVRRTASKANPVALQGIHARHVLYLIDEASGIDETIFEVAQGSLSTTGAMAAMFSNPTRATGFFYDTHHKLRDRWSTRRVSSVDVPRASGHVEEIIDAYGKLSNQYRIRVLGEFPTADEQTIIPLDNVLAAVGRDVTAINVRPIWGVDVARFGDDSSALAKRKGNHLLEPVQEWHGLNIMQLCGKIVEEWNRTDEDMRPVAIMIDEIGLGAGVVDRLRELNLPAEGVNVSESAPNDDKHFRLRDELWARGRDWLAQKNCKIPKDDKLVSELTCVLFDFNSAGQLVVEPKKLMKKRGLKSPNKADAFLNTFARPDQKPKRKDRYSGNEGTSAWCA